MTLDVWLVARLAAELHEAVAGARIQGAAGATDGLRLLCHRRGMSVLLRASLGSDGPLLAIHPAAAANENVAAGWAGGVAPLLRGSSVESVQAVPGDRIVYVDLVSRSAFGVPARHRIAYELEPTKSNILVLRPADDDRWRILAAAKVFAGDDAARSITVGEFYALPPPRRSKLDAGEFAAAIAALDDRSPRALARLLGEHDPACSPPLAREVVDRTSAASTSDSDPAPSMLACWHTLRRDVETAASDLNAPAFAWPRAEGFGVAHVVRLSWPPGTPVRFDSLNAICVTEQATGDRKRQAPAANALRKRLTTMLDRCDAETAALRAAQRRGDEAQAFRRAGDAIYANLAAIPARAEVFVTPEGDRIELDPSLSARANAAGYFRRFKKARSGLPNVARRLGTLEKNRAYWESLLWELERGETAAPDELAALCEEIGAAIGSKAGRAPVRRRRPGAEPPPLPLPGGALAYVGRSPKDNERVTFTVGAPDDLWFHARGIPGAHVILKLPNARAKAGDELILAAAALAAGQSRAADAARVEVDYTQRKHVRKQGGDRVGLVWYTDFKTVLVEPRRLR